MHSSWFFRIKPIARLILKREISGSHMISYQSLLLSTIVLNDKCFNIWKYKFYSRVKIFVDLWILQLPWSDKFLQITKVLHWIAMEDKNSRINFMVIHKSICKKSAKVLTLKIIRLYGTSLTVWHDIKVPWYCPTVTVWLYVHVVKKFKLAP